MSMMTGINYGDALAGRIRRRPSPMHPLGAYMADRGATCRSNEFVDPALTLNEDHFESGHPEFSAGPKTLGHSSRPRGSRVMMVSKFA